MTEREKHIKKLEGQLSDISNYFFSEMGCPLTRGDGCISPSRLDDYDICGYENKEEEIFSCWLEFFKEYREAFRGKKVTGK